MAGKAKSGIGKNRKPQHLLRHWSRVSAALRCARHIVLFLDFDGTLQAFHSRPEKVSLDPSTRRILKRLARRRRLMVCFVSGRRREDLRRRMKVPGAAYIGLYGLERGDGRRAGIRGLEALAQIKRLLRGPLQALSGVWLEDKRASLALHFRQARPSAARRARAALREVYRPRARDLRWLEGNKAVEILSRSVPGKGAAVLEALRRLPRRPLAVYIGDDNSDESAFAALSTGVTARVGRARRTRARYRLRNPKEVRRFLSFLETETA